MKKALVLFIVFTFLFAVGCGSSGGKSPVPNPTQAQKTEAISVGQDTAKFAAIKTATTDLVTPVSGLSAVYSNSTQLALSFMAPTGYEALAQQVSALATTECATKSGNTITYNCAEAGGGITGTITVSGDNITVNLTITSGVSGGEVTIKWTGTITATATLVTGSLHFVTSGTSSGTGYNFTTTLTYNSVALDSTGCPIGGSADINCTISVTGYNMTQDVLATYGPKCGDVALAK
jgi:hypothetical protein